MNESIEEVVNAVEELNSQIYEKTLNDNAWYSYTMDNTILSVAFNFLDSNSFLKVDLWNSDFSQQKYNEETDEYEPLEDTIKRELENVINKLKVYKNGKLKS